MTRMWGIHNDTLGSELVEKGFVSIGWEDVGDLRIVGADKDRIRDAVKRAYSTSKVGAWAVWAGVLHRFAFEMDVGDLVVAPYKPDSTLNFGRIAGPYEHHDVPRHPHRRRVVWLKTGIARGLFPQPALNEIGAAVTLFRVRRHESLFREFLGSGSDESFERVVAKTSAEAAAAAEVLATEVSTDVDADRVEQHTRDFVVNVLLNDLSHEEFEHFTADLLRAMGYEARVSRFAVDGGVDVLAHKDALGLEPPLIKVQCKHTSVSRGAPEVQQLIGTLSANEVGLFVTLGAFTPAATALEREKQQLRLLGGADVVDLVLRHYDQLPSRWRNQLPLKPLLVVDRPPESQ